MRTCAYAHMCLCAYAHVRTDHVIKGGIHLKRKTNMSIDENTLYKIDKAILDTQLFRNRSEMFEYFAGFLDYFDESFKNISIEKAIKKMYIKIHKQVSDDGNSLHKQRKKISLEHNRLRSHTVIAENAVEDQTLTEEEKEIRKGISNFTGGFFK